MVPTSIDDCKALDEQNGNTKWMEAVNKEVVLLRDLFGAFRKEAFPGEVDETYQQIKMLWVFDVKYDGRYRARCVAGGHETTDLNWDMYSGVVDLESVRIGFVIAAIMGLQVVAGDISSAYLQAYTVEKLTTVLGSEFGELAGILVIIVKAVYGSRSASHCWWSKLADCLLAMGFVPSKADFNMWMRKRVDHYEYVAVIVDDLLVFSKCPNDILGPLTDIFKFELKGV